MTRVQGVAMLLALILALGANADADASKATADHGAVVVAVLGSVVAAPGGPVIRFARLDRTATLDLASGASLTLLVDRRHVTLTGPRRGKLAELVAARPGAGDGKARSSLAAAVGALSDWWSNRGSSEEPAAVRGADVLVESPWLVPAPGMLCRPCDGSALPFRLDGRLAAGSSLRFEAAGRAVGAWPHGERTASLPGDALSGSPLRLVAVTGSATGVEIAHWRPLRGRARARMCADLRAARGMATDPEARALLAASVLAQHGCLPQAEMELVAIEDEAQRAGRAVPAGDLPWRQVVLRVVVTACHEDSANGVTCKTSAGALNDAAFKPLAGEVLGTGDIVRLRVTTSRAASLLVVTASDNGGWEKVFEDEVDAAGTSKMRSIPLSVSGAPGRLVVIVSTTGFPHGVPSSADIDRMVATQLTRSPEPGALAAGFGAAALLIELDHE